MNDVKVTGNSLFTNRKPSLTANGNEYKKSNIGKIAGNIPAAGVLGMGIANVVGKGNMGTCASYKEVAANFALGTLLFSLIGTGIGTIIDSTINKSRMAQADGEAKLNKNA